MFSLQSTAPAHGVTWQTPLLQIRGLKPEAAIFELVSAWSVCLWILRPAVALCRRRSQTSSVWKYKNPKSLVRARLNHCATSPPPHRSLPSLWLPTEYCHILWTEINTLPLQRNTAVNVICMVTKSQVRFSSYGSRHYFFLLTFVSRYFCKDSEHYYIF